MEAQEEKKKKSFKKIALYTFFILHISLTIFLFIMLVQTNKYKIDKFMYKYDKEYILNKLSSLESRVNRDEVLELDLTTQSLQHINNDFFVSVKNVEPYLDGYKFTLGFLNKSGLTVSNLKFYMRNGTTTQHITLSDSLLSGHLKETTVIFKNISKDEISNYKWKITYDNASYSYIPHSI